MKRCSKCQIEKPISKFNKRGKSSKGEIQYRGECKDCYNSNWKYRLLSTLTSRECTNRKRPDGTLKKSFYRDKNINLNFLDELKNKQNGKCYWLNIPIDFTLKDNLRKPSLDRLDNSKGYTVDNVVLTTVFANTGRRDSSVNEFEYFLNNYLWKPTN